MLRLLHGAGRSDVTYLAELAGGDPSPWLSPWAGALPDDALRLPYARPGGPAADLAWASGFVAADGRAGAGEDVEPLVDLAPPDGRPARCG